MIELLKPYIPEILLFISGASAWGYERNKRKQELKASETSNNKSIMDLYQEALTDLKNRYDADIQELLTKYDAKFNEMEKRYSNLKRAFEEYKRTHK